MIFRILSWIWAGFVVFSHVESHPPMAGIVGLGAIARQGLFDVACGLGFVVLAWLAGMGILARAGCGAASLVTAAGALPAGLFAMSLVGGGLSLVFPVPVALAGTLAVLAWPAIRAVRNPDRHIAASRLKQLFSDRTLAAAAVAVLALALLDLPGLLAPATGYDDQVYHLTIPKLYNAGGGIRHLPELPPANRPQSLHVVYMLLGCFAGDTASRAISWAFSFLTPLLLAVVVGWRVGPAAGALAAIAWRTHPEISLLARTAYTDLPITHILLATIFLLSELRTRAPAAVLPALCLVAAFAGGVKTSGLGILFLAIGGAPVIIRLRPDWNEHQNVYPAILLKFAIATALLGFPWYFRNWYITGNPIYPHMGHLWHFTRYIPVAIAAFDKVFGVPLPFAYDHTLLLDRFGMGRDTLSMLLLPWNVTIHGHVHDSVYSLRHFDGEIGFLPLALAPLLAMAFIERKRHPDHAGLAVISLAAFGLWAAGSHQIRFLLPSLGILAVLSGFRMASAYADRRLVLLLSIAAVIQGASFSMTRNMRLEPWIAGRETSGQYLERELPFHAAYSWFNEHAQAGDKLLPVFEERVYHLSRPFQWMELVPFPMISAFMAADAPGRVVEYLRAFGVTHLYLPAHGAGFLSEVSHDPGYRETVARFFADHATVVFSDRNGTIHRIGK